MDYTPENLVHADLSPEEFQDSMADRGESWLGMFWQAMRASMRPEEMRQMEAIELELFASLFAPDRELRLKRLLARQFTQLDRLMQAIEGEKGSTLVSQRNARVLEVLQTQMQKKSRRIAIFYGAGHMPDLARRLKQECALRPVRIEWLDAWDLQAEPIPRNRPTRQLSR